MLRHQVEDEHDPVGPWVDLDADPFEPGHLIEPLGHTAPGLRAQAVTRAHIDQLEQRGRGLGTSLHAEFHGHDGPADQAIDRVLGARRGGPKAQGDGDAGDAGQAWLHRNTYRSLKSSANERSSFRDSTQDTWSF